MSRLRTWMAPFRGVGTAYLSNFLGWMRLKERTKDERRFPLEALIGSSFVNIGIE